MSEFRDNVYKARGYIVFVASLLAAFALVIQIERMSGQSLIAKEPVVTFSDNRPVPPRARPLTEAERAQAQIAWKYFENNTRPETGLVDSVEKYTATTMWDTASYLLATISAHEIGIVPREEFDRRIERALQALATMPLFEESLPNKSYSTLTLAMVDYRNQPSPRGIGWSAIDVARLLVPMNILVWRYPEHAVAARRVVARWKTDRLGQAGVLQGAMIAEDGRTALKQEGRLGYEQYAAKTFILMGLDANEAVHYPSHLAYLEIDGIEVPYDDRDPKRFEAHNYVLSEPYVLDGLEFGWDTISREFAWRVYSAQLERHRRTGILTAVTEDHIDEAPYFVYNTVYSDGKEWNTITDTGADASAHRTLSVKAAFGWHALYQSEYSEALLKEVSSLHDPQRGWYGGRYEASGETNEALSANTNAVVLESLAFIQNGSLIRYKDVGESNQP
jgi:Protein of unknown function (DUF3131)